MSHKHSANQRTSCSFALLKMLKDYGGIAIDRDLYLGWAAKVEQSIATILVELVDTKLEPTDDNEDEQTKPMLQLPTRVALGLELLLRNGYVSSHGFGSEVTFLITGKGTGKLTELLEKGPSEQVNFEARMILTEAEDKGYLKRGDDSCFLETGKLIDFYEKFPR